MHIILTIDFSPWSAHGGGAQRSTHNLATALCRRGHDVSVVYTKPPWETIAHPRHLPYDLHWATFFDVRSRRNAPLRPLNAFSVARVVESLLDRKQDTVIHSNGEEGGMIHRLRQHYRFGFIATPRHPRYPHALLNNNKLSSLDKVWLALREGKYLMQGRAARHADLCVPPSAFAADLVRRAFHLKPPHVRVVHNGVPEEFLSYDLDPVAMESGPLVFFGKFHAIKGVDTLVDALGIIGAEAPRTLLIGRGPEKQAIERQIQRLGLADRVELLPWMPQDELARILSGARMVVLPSREENFSLAILGAMAVGVPVISTRVGGTPEIIHHNHTGILVEPDAPEALAAAITRLLKDPEKALQLGRAGRCHVREHLTWDRAAASFEALYHQLLGLDDHRGLESDLFDIVEPAQVDADHALV
ncbi:MAG: glycosyltransferase family 4 protein [Rhodothermales bacterium]